MKSAVEMRKISIYGISDAMKYIETEIENNAHDGLTDCQIFLAKDEFKLNDGKISNIRKVLEKDGYKVSTKTIFDQRDGDSVKFSIKW